MKTENYRTTEIENTEKYEDNQEYYYDNQDKFEAHCVRCGKGIKNLQYGVHEVDGGGYALHNDDWEIWNNTDGSSRGDLGEQYLGSECKKHIDKNYFYKIK